MARKTKTGALVPVVLEPERSIEQLAQGLQKANWYLDVLSNGIADDDELKAAKALVQHVHADLKAWQEAREAATRPLKDEYDMRRSVFAPVLERLEKVKQVLKASIGRFELERLQASRALMAQSAAQAPDQAIQTRRQARAAMPEKAAGVSVTTKFQATLVDADAAPEKYRRWYIDMDAVQKDVDAGARDIPGMLIEEVPLVRL